MNNKSIQFLEKLEELSEEVNLYFFSELSGEAISAVSKDHGLDYDYVYELLLDFVISNFDLKALRTKIVLEIQNEENQKSFVADFLGNIFLAIDDFVDSVISKELKKMNVDPAKYEKHVKGFEEIIDEKNLDSVFEVLDSFEFDEREEERLSLNFLEKNLVEILKFSDPDGVRKINGSILQLLMHKEDSHTRLSRAFLSNKENLTKEYLIIEGRKQEPTVSNWVKDFVKESGSDMFSSISLAKYLSSSINCIKLDEEEKRLVKKVLRLYRNLNFFPDSMKDVPFLEWEIIPIDKDDTVKEQKKVVAPLPVKPKEEAPELEELSKLLKSNPDKNLKRKAIESEIKKIKKNN